MQIGRKITRNITGKFRRYVVLLLTFSEKTIYIYIYDIDARAADTLAKNMYSGVTC